MNTTSKTFTAPANYRQSSQHPIRFDRLHPGSHFRIVAEPQRGIRRSRDNAIYKKARDGFYATNVSNNSPACLLPEDLVMPVVRERTA
jgi:hypothetical protein